MTTKAPGELSQNHESDSDNDDDYFSDDEEFRELQLNYSTLQKTYEKQTGQMSLMEKKIHRRAVLIETIRTSYLKDVIALKQAIEDYIPAEEKERFLAIYGDSIPSVDIRKALVLHNPHNAHFTMSTCEHCGGQGEIVFHDSKQVSELKEVISGLKDQRQGLRLEIATAAANYETLLTEKTSLEIRHKEEKKVFFEEKRDLRTQLQEREVRIQELTQDVSKVRKKVESAELKAVAMNKLTSQTEVQAVEISSLRERLEAAFKKYAAVESHSLALEQVVEKDKETIRKLEDERDRLTEELTHNVEQLKLSRERVKELEREAVGLNQTLQTSNQQRVAAELKLMTIRQEMEEATALVAADVERLEQSNDKLREEASLLQRHISSLQNEAEVLKEERDAAEAESREKEEQLGEMIDSMASLQNQVERMRENEYEGMDEEEEWDQDEDENAGEEDEEEEDLGEEGEAGEGGGEGSSESRTTHSRVGKGAGQGGVSLPKNKGEKISAKAYNMKKNSSDQKSKKKSSGKVGNKREHTEKPSSVPEIVSSSPSNDSSPPTPSIPSLSVDHQSVPVPSQHSSSRDSGHTRHSSRPDTGSAHRSSLLEPSDESSLNSEAQPSLTDQDADDQGDDSHSLTFDDPDHPRPNTTGSVDHHPSMQHAARTANIFSRPRTTNNSAVHRDRALRGQPQPSAGTASSSHRPKAQISNVDNIELDDLPEDSPVEARMLREMMLEVLVQRVGANLAKKIVNASSSLLINYGRMLSELINFSWSNLTMLKRWFDFSVRAHKIFEGIRSYTKPVLPTNIKIKNQQSSKPPEPTEEDSEDALHSTIVVKGTGIHSIEEEKLDMSVMHTFITSNVRAVEKLGNELKYIAGNLLSVKFTQMWQTEVGLNEEICLPLTPTLNEITGTVVYRPYLDFFGERMREETFSKKLKVFRDSVEKMEAMMDPFLSRLCDDLLGVVGEWCEGKSFSATIESRLLVERENTKNELVEPIMHLRREMVAQKGRAETYSKAVSKMETQLAEATSEIHRILPQALRCDRAENDAKLLTVRVNDLNSQNLELRRDNERLTSELTKLKSEFLDTKQRLRVKEEALDGANTSVHEMSEEIALLRKNLHNIKLELQTIREDEQFRRDGMTSIAIQCEAQMREIHTQTEFLIPQMTLRTAIEKGNKLHRLPVPIVLAATSPSLPPPSTALPPPPSQAISVSLTEIENSLKPGKPFRTTSHMAPSPSTSTSIAIDDDISEFVGEVGMNDSSLAWGHSLSQSQPQPLPKTSRSRGLTTASLDPYHPLSLTRPTSLNEASLDLSTMKGGSISSFDSIPNRNSAHLLSSSLGSLELTVQFPPGPALLVSSGLPTPSTSHPGSAPLSGRGSSSFSKSPSASSSVPLRPYNSGGHPQGQTRRITGTAIGRLRDLRIEDSSISSNPPSRLGTSNSSGLAEFSSDLWTEVSGGRLGGSRSHQTLAPVSGALKGVSKVVSQSNAYSGDQLRNISTHHGVHSSSTLLRDKEVIANIIQQAKANSFSNTQNSVMDLRREYFGKKK